MNRPKKVKCQSKSGKELNKLDSGLEKKTQLFNLNQPQYESSSDKSHILHTKGNGNKHQNSKSNSKKVSFNKQVNLDKETPLAKTNINSESPDISKKRDFLKNDMEEMKTAKNISISSNNVCSNTKKRIRPQLTNPSTISEIFTSSLSKKLNGRNSNSKKNYTRQLTLANETSNAQFSNQLENMNISDAICVTDVYQSDSAISETNTIYCVMSQGGKLIDNTNKENQDSYFMVDNLFGFEGCTIFGVMDGHGINGQLVSNFIKKEAIEYFCQFDTYKSSKNKGNDNIFSESNIYDVIINKNYNFISSFCCLTENKLKLGKFDVHYSGATCVMVFLINGKLICSNTGDSRAILVNHNKSGVFTVEAISNDHKPGEPKEKTRILEKGGILRKDEEGENIYRVWIKDTGGPGIAISRTIGDEVASSVGVIPEPEIIEKTITDEMSYIIAGSDGIWDFIDNEMAMNIVNPWYMKNNPKEACRSLVNEATKFWIKEGGAIDDITCAIYFIKPYKECQTE